MASSRNAVPWHHSSRTRWQSFEEKVVYKYTRKPQRVNKDGPNTHHFANTTTSASDQHDFTVDTEEILNVKGGHNDGSKKGFGELEYLSPGIKPTRNLTGTGTGKRRKMCETTEITGKQLNKANRSDARHADVSSHPQVYRQYMLIYLHRATRHLQLQETLQGQSSQMCAKGTLSQAGSLVFPILF